MTLELRQVEVRTGSTLEQLRRVVVHDEAEVEEARRDRLAVDLHMPLVQMPAARADDERRDLVVEAVALLGRLEDDLAAHRVADVLLAVDHVLPRRRARILEVAHEDAP